MAADNIDAKTRAVEKMKAEPGKEMAAYQAAENQLLAIQAEQKQNLAVARAQSAAAVQQNNTIAQAADVVAASGGAAQVQQVPVNAATQGVLGKYGMGPTISKTTTRQNQTVTKQNITINNYNTTTNNTTNNVPNTGPVQGRPVVVNRDDTGRFKVWVNNVIAKQSEQAAIRDKEFEKRESALTRSANRMTRKLESISTNLSEKLDPRRLNNSLGSSFKTVITMMGIGLIAKNWPKIVKAIVGIEKRITNFLDYFGITGRDKRNKAGADSRIVQDLKYLLGGDRYSGKDVSLFDVFKDLLMGKGGVLDVIKKKVDLFVENRRDAISKIQMPEFKLRDIPGSIKELGVYLGKLISTLIGGSKAVITAKAEAKREESEKKDTENNNEAEKNFYSGSKRVVLDRAKGEFRDVLRGDTAKGALTSGIQEHDLDGNSLLNNSGSAIRQSISVAEKFNTTDGTLDTGGILAGLLRLEKTAREKEFVAVDPKMLEALKGIGVNVEELVKNKKKFKYVYKNQDFIEKSNMKGSSNFWENAGRFLNSSVGYRETDKKTGKVTSFKNKGYSTIELVPADDKRYSQVSNEELKKYFGVDISGDGTVEYNVLTTDDFDNIKKQLGEISGHQDDFSFNASDVASTTALGNYILKSQPDKFTKDEGLLDLKEYQKQQEEYERQQDKVYEGTQTQLAVNRTLEKGRELTQSGKNKLKEIEDAITIDPSKGIFYRKSGQEAEQDFDRNNDSNAEENIITKRDESGKLVNDKGQLWDVDKAVAAIRREAKNLNTEETGQCARWVGLAVEEGFGKRFNFRKTPLSSVSGNGNRWEMEAKKEGPKLEALGFVHIPNDSVPEKGDIRVFQPKDKKKAGHIAMFDGENWYSDFKQNSYHGYKDPVNNIASSALYRFGVKSQLINEEEPDESIDNESAMPAPDNIDNVPVTETTNPSMLAGTEVTISPEKKFSEKKISETEIESVYRDVLQSSVSKGLTPEEVDKSSKIIAKTYAPAINAAWEKSGGIEEKFMTSLAKNTFDINRQLRDSLGETLYAKIDKIIANQQQGNAINLTTAQAAAANVDATYTTGQATAAAASHKNGPTASHAAGWTS